MLVKLLCLHCSAHKSIDKNSHGRESGDLVYVVYGDRKKGRVSGLAVPCPENWTAMREDMSEKNIFAELDPIFHPRSLALIGASGKQGKIGRVLTERFLETGFQKFYPVNQVCILEVSPAGK